MASVAASDPWRWSALGLFVTIAVAGCGARTGLANGHRDGGAGDDAGDAGFDAPVDAPECVTDTDCTTEDLCAPVTCAAGRCVLAPGVTCDDGDECTADSCDPLTAACANTPVTFDQDGDGYRGPRSGFEPGAPGACGDDCDDTSPDAHPGGIEICDGVDNDCNGVIDDDARYEPAGTDVQRVSSSAMKQAGVGGLVWNGSFYAATYSGQNKSWTTLVQGLGPSGQSVWPETRITNSQNDTFTGPIVWTGATFGTAWEDRRSNDYEIYFNRLDANGKKLDQDLRISNAQGFSLHPSMIWTGQEFVLFWDDARNGDQKLYAQRISVDGQRIDDNLPVSQGGGELPVVASGEHRLGVAYNFGGTLSHRIAFRTFDYDLTGGSDFLLVSGVGGVEPSVAWVGDRFVIAWATRDDLPGDSIWAATVDENGKVLQPEQRVATGADFARSQSIVSLGDRLLLVWAADQGTGNYEIYSKMLSQDLTELTPRARITRHTSDSVYPIAVFGPDGDVGVFFNGLRTSNWQTYFTRLVCRAGVAPPNP